MGHKGLCLSVLGMHRWREAQRSLEPLAPSSSVAVFAKCPERLRKGRGSAESTEKEIGCPLGMLPPAWLCSSLYFVLNALTPVLCHWWCLAQKQVGLGASLFQ